MKGYVEFEIAEDVKNRMVAYLDKAQTWLATYDVANYSTKVYKTTWFTKQTYFSHSVLHNARDVAKTAPLGVKVTTAFCLNDEDLIEHEVGFTGRAKAVKKILSLYDNNNTIMLDDELASVYNTFKD